MSQRPVVLFACVHNAGRSQMAAGFARALAGEAVEVLSGGSAPADEVNPAAVEAMREVGIDVATETPRRWADADVERADVVVTMGCGDECPFYPGTHYEDWDVADPAGQSLDAVRPIRDELKDRVQKLMAELGVGLRD